MELAWGGYYKGNNILHVNIYIYMSIYTLAPKSNLYLNWLFRMSPIYPLFRDQGQLEPLYRLYSDKNSVRNKIKQRNIIKDESKYGRSGYYGGPCGQKA